MNLWTFPFWCVPFPHIYTSHYDSTPLFLFSSFLFLFSSFSLSLIPSSPLLLFLHYRTRWKHFKFENNSIWWRHVRAPHSIGNLNNVLCHRICWVCCTGGYVVRTLSYICSLSGSFNYLNTVWIPHFLHYPNNNLFELLSLVVEYFEKIDSDLKMGSEEEFLLDAVKRRRKFGKIFCHTILTVVDIFLICFSGMLLAVNVVIVNESRQEREDVMCTWWVEFHELLYHQYYWIVILSSNSSASFCLFDLCFQCRTLLNDIDHSFIHFFLLILIRILLLTFITQHLLFHLILPS